MNYKKMFYAVGVVAISLTSLYAQSDSDFEVLQNPDNTITITKYKGNVKNVVIPSTLYGLKVTGIGDGAFYRRNLNGVVLPNTLVSIGKYAFSNSFWDAVCTKTSGFISCNGSGDNTFTEIVIPNSVTVVGGKAFSLSTLNTEDRTGPFKKSNRGSLKRVSFEGSPKYIGDFAFEGNSIKELTIPDSVEYIGEEAFRSNEIEQINLGAGIKVINGGAFDQNQLRSVVLPKGVAIGRAAFANNQIKSISIPDDVSLYSHWGGNEYKGAFYRNPLSTLVITGSLKIDWLTFDLPLTRITIPANKDDDFLKKAGFQESFVNFYKSQNRVGKTYYKSGPIWTNDEKVGDSIIALEKKIGDYDIASEKANVAFGKDDFDGTISFASEAIRLLPKLNFGIWLTRGMAYFFKKDYGKAISDFSKSITLEPNEAVTYLWRGNAYCEKGEYKKATDDFNKVLQMSNDDSLIKGAKGGLQRAQKGSGKR